MEEMNKFLDTISSKENMEHLNERSMMWLATAFNILKNILLWE